MLVQSRSSCTMSIPQIDPINAYVLLVKRCTSKGDTRPTASSSSPSRGPVINRWSLVSSLVTLKTSLHTDVKLLPLTRN